MLISKLLIKKSMATYSYKCLNCNNVFNLRATIKEKEEAKDEKFTCPKCQSKSIKYNFSLANFFKNIFNSDNNSSNCCSGKKF